MNATSPLLGRHAHWLLGALVMSALSGCACNEAAKTPAASPQPAAASESKNDQPNARSGDKPAEQPPTYLNPEEAQRRIDRFKEGIGRSPK